MNNERQRYDDAIEWIERLCGYEWDEYRHHPGTSRPEHERLWTMKRLLLVAQEHGLDALPPNHRTLIDEALALADFSMAEFPKPAPHDLFRYQGHAKNWYEAHLSATQAA